MTEAEESFYTEERWQNWLTRVSEEEIDFEDESSARLLWNMREDTAIAVAKLVSAYEDGRLDAEEARERIDDIRTIVLAEPELEDATEEQRILIDDVQTSLVCVFFAGEEYIAGGPVDEGTVEEYVQAAAEVEESDGPDAALGYLVQAGTLIIDGADLDVSIVDDLDIGFTSVWVNGLDSLHSAMSDPEVVEPEDDE